MFYKNNEYNPIIDDQYSEKITSLKACGSRIFIGREDGYLETIGSNCNWKTLIFQKEYDLLENDMVGEQLLAIENMTDGGIHDILFVGNEKTIAVLKVRNDQSTIGICRDDPANGIRIVNSKKCSNAHNYLINSLTINLSKTVLLSSDFLKINMWSPDHMDKYYNIIDLKPSTDNEDNISSLINTTKFSPFSDKIFAWSSSNGKVNIHDIGISPKSQCVSVIDGTHHHHVKSISDISFIDQNLIISRSVNNVFLSDLRKPDKHVFSKNLISNSYLLNLMDALKANYLSFKICNDSMFAYTGSCFEGVYAINITTGDLQEIEVGKKNNLSIDKSIKLIVPAKSGFWCAFNGKLHSFKTKFE